MTRRTPWRMAALVALATLLAPCVASATTTLPGSALTASPVTVPVLDAAGAEDRAVYQITVGTAETISLSLNADPAAIASGLDLDLYLYAPGTATLDHAAALAKATGPATAYPETIAYQVPAAGTYYVEVFAYRGTGASTLAWAVLPEPLLPVYRFYNMRNGTHFYTPTDAERDQVITQWGYIYRYEGIAYQTRASKNEQPLYRFFNMRNGSHFYTASPSERDQVITQWGYIYRYEGETYSVSLSGGPGKTPVYRFFNTRAGSHFYTISEAERDTVLNNWPGIYRFENVAFYIGQ